MERIIIIGGMGPQASLELHSRIIRAATEHGARNGNDFPFILHLSPPIDDFISDKSKTKGALAMITGELRRVRPTANDAIILACNTAHLLKEDIEREFGVKLMSLIEATMEHIARENIRKVELMASPTSIHSGLYSEPLRESGIEVVEPSDTKTDELENAIRSVIAGRAVKAGRTDGVVKLLGCTELSCLFAGKPNVIDPMDIIVEKLVTEGRVL